MILRRLFLFSSFAWLLLLVPVQALHAEVVLDKVLFNPPGKDTSLEYVVLRNTAAEAADLSGWDLYPDGIGYFTFPSFILGGGEMVTVHLRTSGTNSESELYHENPSKNMGNTSGSVALFSDTKHGSGTIVDFIEYGRGGETWESAADKAGLWTKGEFVPVDAQEEDTILKRVSFSYGAGSWTLEKMDSVIDEEEEMPVDVEAPPTQPEIDPYVEEEISHDNEETSGAVPNADEPNIDESNTIDEPNTKEPENNADETQEPAVAISNDDMEEDIQPSPKEITDSQPALPAQDTKSVVPAVPVRNSTEENSPDEDKTQIVLVDSGHELTANVGKSNVLWLALSVLAGFFLGGLVFWLRRVFFRYE